MSSGVYGGGCEGMRTLWITPDGRQTMKPDKRNHPLVKKELSKLFRGKTALWFKAYVEELTRADWRRKRPMLRTIAGDSKNR